MRDGQVTHILNKLIKSQPGSAVLLSVAPGYLDTNRIEMTCDLRSNISSPFSKIRNVIVYIE